MDRLNSRWLRQYEAIDLLREFRNKEVLYLPNSGNAGDSLISTATMQFFRRLNISYQAITLDANVDGKTVILGGGGNFIPLYATIKNAFLRFAGRAKRIVLLPHTIRGNEDVISDLPADVLLICREIPSYDHVISVNPKCETALAHDMAFHLDPDELLVNDPDADEFQKVFLTKLADAGVTPSAFSKRAEMRFFRTDGESTGKHGSSDLDISSLFEFGVWPRNSEKSSWCFLEAIRISQAVATDRLHVGIGSAMLGKPCKLHDNSYGKNREVFRHSLRRWSSVSFVE
ncbi:polysaccharide pyruvyl transferase family protein [Phreatobacter stygius]|nr:polysaccharide pyruvyl transferase family protein [Phreatobacter stygius]